MCPKLRDWEGERVPKIDEIWMLACIKNSMQNGWFWRQKFKKIVKKKRFQKPSIVRMRFCNDSIDSPQGGATAASPFVCRNVGGPPCLVGLHVQDCIAEGTWGNDIFNFGYDLASIFARAT